MSLLQRAAAARRRGAFDRAISALKEVLAKRDTWKWQPPAAVSAKIAERCSSWVAEYERKSMSRSGR